MNKKKWIIACSVSLLIAGFGFYVLPIDANEIEVTHAQKQLRTLVVTEEEWPITTNYTGFVTAAETKNYAFMTSGRLEDIYVEKGDVIKAGDILATVDIDYIKFPDQQNTYAMEQSIEAAITGLKTLETQLESTRILYDQGAASKVSLDALEAEYKSRQAALETLKSNYEIQKNQANKNSSDGVLIADSDGYAIDVRLEKGEVVSAGVPVVISKSKEAVINIGVSLEDYEKVNHETPVWINDQIAGTIKRIGAYPDEYTMTYPVEISLEAGQLAMGEIVEVSLEVERTSCVSVPIESVVNIGGIDYVYTVDVDGNAKRREVVLGRIHGKDVQVSNLPEGQRIVTEGVKYLRANDQILIWEESEASS